MFSKRLPNYAIGASLLRQWAPHDCVEYYCHYSIAKQPVAGVLHACQSHTDVRYIHATCELTLADLRPYAIYTDTVVLCQAAL